MTDNIYITKLSASNIVRLPKLSLNPWNEIIGEYIGSTMKDKTFYVAIDVNGKKYCLSVKKKSKEYKILRKAIRSILKKTKLAILVTDNTDTPIRVNKIDG